MRPACASGLPPDHGRHPSDKERAVLVKLFTEQKALFEDPAAVKKLLAVGQTEPAAAVGAELAAATVLGEPTILTTMKP